MRPLLAAALVLAACDTGTCPQGSARVGGVCLAEDAALPTDAGPASDAAPANDATSPADACTGAACTGACAPDCTPSAPVCSDGRCGPCTADVECDAFADTPHCAGGKCVACAADSDCTDPAKSACDPTSHTCVPCAPAVSGPDAQCAHIPGKNVCSAGTCVACTQGKRDACGSAVCDATTHTCDPTRAQHSKTLCNVCAQGPAAGTPCVANAPCVSDDECQLGEACVKQAAGGGDAVCLKVFDDKVGCARPYVLRYDDVEAVEGARVSVCSFATAATCQAQRDWRTKRCGTPDPGVPSHDVRDSGNDALCGVDGINDGVCSWDSSRLQLRCTVSCKGEVDDCPTDATACVSDADHTNITICSLY